MAGKGKSSEYRAGKRRDRSARFASREPILGYYLIVTDTEETEKNYFEGLKNSIPPEIRERIVIKVEKAKTTYSLVERTMELCGEQAQQRIPWIVFDRDQVKNFDEIIRAAQRNDIYVGWSNPCFEIWMFAYFGEMPSFTDSVICCSRFAARFKEITGHTYQKNDVDVYKRLIQYGNFDTAYRLAEQRIVQAESDRKKPSESCPACTVHRLVKKITDKVESYK